MVKYIYISLRSTESQISPVRWLPRCYFHGLAAFGRKMKTLTRACLSKGNSNVVITEEVTPRDPGKQSLCPPRLAEGYSFMFPHLDLNLPCLSLFACRVVNTNINTLLVISLQLVKISELSFLIPMQIQANISLKMCFPASL